jgi:hypothetical protein
LVSTVQMFKLKKYRLFIHKSEEFQIVPVMDLSKSLGSDYRLECGDKRNQYLTEW